MIAPSGTPSKLQVFGALSVILLAERSRRRASRPYLFTWGTFYFVYHGTGGDPLGSPWGGMTRASRGLLCSSKREHGGGGVRRDPNGVRASEGASPHACPEPRLTRTPPDQNLDRAARGEWGGGGGLGGHGVWTHLAPRCSAMPPPPLRVWRDALGGR